MKTWLYLAIGKLLPEHLVRTLFLSSLYAKLFDVKVFDIQTAVKVNGLLHISRNNYAMGAGVKLSHVFWDDIALHPLTVNQQDDNPILDKAVEESIIQKIMDGTPKALRYNREVMLNDIKTMMEKRLDLSYYTQLATA